MKHIILFGGTFDPIHYGHFEIAKRALKELKADELWFLLAAESPFKKEGTSFYHRKKMIEMMISPFNKMQVCEIENDLPKPSYSIDTVKALKKKHPNVYFSWLLGSDQIKDLDKWKNIEELEKLVNFVVYDRPNYDDPHQFSKISGTKLDVSSTDIRTGKSTFTKPSILRYMMQEALYLETMTQPKMSEKRYEHTLRVTKLALELAKHHKLDLKKMKLIAMTHDWYKEVDDKTLLNMMKASYPKLLTLPEALYHGFAASYKLSKEYYIRDKDVLSAVRVHVTGLSHNKYGMILYIADKCEPARNYDTKPLIQLSKQNLNKGFKAVKLNSEKYLKENL